MRARRSLFGGEVHRLLKRQLVDLQERKADDEKVGFEFDLGAAAITARPVDLVTVRVCRLSSKPGIPYDYCGPEQRYVRP